MDYPKRTIQHIHETESFKIFENSIPSEWIIRQVTERDYGIDLYLELVKSNGEVSGNMVSIQIKSSNQVDWNSELKTPIFGIKATTTNYWYSHIVPVYICLADISKAQVYFLSVKEYIRENYSTFLSNSSFKYEITKSNFLSKDDTNNFLTSYFLEKRRKYLDLYLVDFISNYDMYKDFITNGIDADFFLGVEWKKEIYVQNIYNVFFFLCDYFSIKWDLEAFKIYSEKSKEQFGDNYNLYEQQLSEILILLVPKLLQIFSSIIELVTKKEDMYWYYTNNTIYQLLMNTNIKDGIPNI